MPTYGGNLMRKLIGTLLTALLMGLFVHAFAAQTPAEQLCDLNLSQASTYANLDPIRLKERHFENLLQFLNDHPNLTHVDMFDSRLNAEQLDTLAARYPQIQFGWTIRLVDEHYVRTDATAYAINHNRRSPLHSSEDFRQLKYCKDLMALDLGHNKIRDISFMRDLPKLRVIIMANNYIEDISPLADLKNLEYAELFNNYITDFSPLAGLDKLIDLNVCFNEAKDLSPLYKLKALDRLWVYKSYSRKNDQPMPEENVVALQEALPDTFINAHSYSTAGGWRTHERYYVVFNMLHGAVAWLPWDADGLVPRYN